MKKIKAFLLALAVIFTLAPATVSMAADNDVTSFKGYYSTPDFGYKVRIYSGAQGTFGDGSTVYEMQVAPGTTVDFRSKLASIQVADNSKYYAKGLRESGKDNNTVKGTVFTIEEDMDYVVAYGMEGGDVAYTIQYVNADGVELSAPETHYGNAGDKPVVAFKYIEGYVPQAFNLTKTLVAGEDNIFKFVYVPGDSSRFIYTVTDGGVTVIYIDGGETTSYVPGNIVYLGEEDGGVTVITQGGGGGAGDGDGAGAGDNLVEIGDADVPLAGPQDLIDIDAGEVPLGGFDLEFDYTDQGANAIGFMQLPNTLKALIVVSILALLAVAIYTAYHVAKKKKEDKAIDELLDEKNKAEDKE